MVDLIVIGALILSIIITISYSVGIRIFIDSNRHKYRHKQRKQVDPVKRKKKSQKHKFRVIHYLVAIDFGMISFGLVFPVQFGSDPKIYNLSANKTGSVLLGTMPNLTTDCLFVVNLMYVLFLLVPAVWYFSTHHFELAPLRCGRKTLLVSWVILSVITFLSISVLFLTVLYITGPQK